MGAERAGPEDGSGVSVDPDVERADPRWVVAVDGALDGALVSFALWTLIYECALAGQWSLWWPARIWIVPAVAIVVLGVRRALVMNASDLEPDPEPDPDESSAGNPTGHPRAARALAVVLGLLVVLVVLRGVVGVLPLAVAGIACLLLGLWVRDLGRSSSARDARSSPAHRRTHVVVALSCVVLAVLSSLIIKTDDDDTYYVNRATWVAQHGYPTMKDSMFSPGKLGSIYDVGLPLPSVESLQGAVAHVFGLAAPDVTYVLGLPLLAAAFGWTTWRVAREWAPSHPGVVYAVAVVFTLFSADSVIGNYSITRLWQGKAIAFAILIPLVWLYLSRLVSRQDRWSRTMLLVCGICFVGLTTTASLLAPVVGGAALVAAALLRSRWLAVGAVAFLLAPVAAGIAVTLAPAAIGGADPVATPVGDAFEIVLGTTTPMILLGVLGVVLSPLVVRGPLGVLLACCSGTSLVALLPGVFSVVNALTGAGAIAWRLLLGPPVALMLGLLVTWPLRAGWWRPGFWQQRWLRAGRVSTWLGGVWGSRPTDVVSVTAVALVAAVLAFGVPIWSSRAGAVVTSTPTWKVPQVALADLRAAERRHTEPGLWLLPPQQMEILAISTTKHNAVVPRHYYLGGLSVSATALDDREVLFGLVTHESERVPEVRDSLRTLGVSVACVQATDPRARITLSRAVREKLEPVGSMSCHFGQP